MALYTEILNTNRVENWNCAKVKTCAVDVVIWGGLRLQKRSACKSRKLKNMTVVAVLSNSKSLELQGLKYVLHLCENKWVEHKKYM